MLLTLDTLDTLDTSCGEKSEVQKRDGTLRKLWFLFSVSFPVTARDRIQILHFSDRKISSTYWADGEIDLEIQQMFANTNIPQFQEHTFKSSG